MNLLGCGCLSNCFNPQHSNHSSGTASPAHSPRGEDAAGTSDEHARLMENPGEQGYGAVVGSASRSRSNSLRLRHEAVSSVLEKANEAHADIDGQLPMFRTVLSQDMKSGAFLRTPYFPALAGLVRLGEKNPQQQQVTVSFFGSFREVFDKPVTKNENHGLKLYRELQGFLEENSVVPASASGDEANPILFARMLMGDIQLRIGRGIRDAIVEGKPLASHAMTVRMLECEDGASDAELLTKLYVREPGAVELDEAELYDSSIEITDELAKGVARDLFKKSGGMFAEAIKEGESFTAPLLEPDSESARDFHKVMAYLETLPENLKDEAQEIKQKIHFHLGEILETQVMQSKMVPPGSAEEVTLGQFISTTLLAQAREEGAIVEHPYYQRMLELQDEVPLLYDRLWKGFKANLLSALATQIKEDVYASPRISYEFKGNMVEFEQIPILDNGVYCELARFGRKFGEPFTGEHAHFFRMMHEDVGVIMANFIAHVERDESAAILRDIDLDSEDAIAGLREDLRLEVLMSMAHGDGDFMGRIKHRLKIDADPAQTHAVEKDIVRHFTRGEREFFAGLKWPDLDGKLDDYIARAEEIVDQCLKRYKVIQLSAGKAKAKHAGFDKTSVLIGGEGGTVDKNASREFKTSLLGGGAEERGFERLLKRVGSDPEGRRKITKLPTRSNTD